MYADLAFESDFFIIETLLKNNEWLPIGDVTLAKDCMPIVIGDSRFRGRGFAKQILLKLIALAREKGFFEINLKEIFDANIPSIKLFESVGFKKNQKTKNGYSYKLEL